MKTLSKIEKIWQESTIWFPKHERTNDVPPEILKKLYLDTPKEPKVHVTEFIKPKEKANGFLELAYSKDPAPDSLRRRCVDDQYSIKSFAKPHAQNVFEEYRACFKCGERWHLLAHFPYVRHKRHEVEMRQSFRKPVDNHSYPERRFLPQL